MTKIWKSSGSHDPSEIIIICWSDAHLLPIIYWCSIINNFFYYQCWKQFFLLICFYYIFVKTILYVFQDSLMDRKGGKRIYLFLNVFIVIINVFADTL